LHQKVLEGGSKAPLRRRIGGVIKVSVGKLRRVVYA
jgi:hypothetical protein